MCGGSIEPDYMLLICLVTGQRSLNPGMFKAGVLLDHSQEPDANAVKKVKS